MNNNNSLFGPALSAVSTPGRSESVTVAAHSLVLAARQQLDRGEGDATFLQAKIQTGELYAEHILVEALSLANIVMSRHCTNMAFDEANF